MSNDYRLSINYEGQEYQLDLTRTSSDGANSVTLGKTTYSVRMQPENSALTNILLEQLASSTRSTVEEIARDFTHISHIGSVRISTVSKTNDVALSELSPGKMNSDIARRKSAVETGIIPAFLLSPGASLQPTSIENRMKEIGVPGVSIAVINNGEVEWSSGYGQLQNSSALIQAASISKTAAALTILSLIDQCKRAVDEGRPSGLKDNTIITLDTDVSTLLDKELWQSIDPKGLAVGDTKMTIRHLLSHMAGTSIGGFVGYPRQEQINQEIDLIQNQINNPPPGNPEALHKLQKRLLQLENSQSQAANETELPSVDEILKGSESSDKVNTPRVTIEKPPGTEFKYSGGGSTILQKIVIDLTEQSFEDAVQDRVFTKLGMKDSTYHPGESRAAHGNDADSSPVPGGCLRHPELAAAGLWTTPNDLAKMAIGIQRSLNGESNGVISQSLAKEMVHPQMAGGDNGLGVFMDKDIEAGSSYFWHNGTNEGFQCLLIATPEGQGAAIMTNSDLGRSLYTEITGRIADVYDWPNKNSITLLTPVLTTEEINAIAVSPPPDLSKWESRSGTYELTSAGGKYEITLSAENGKIFIQDDNVPAQEVIPLTNSIGRVGLQILRFIPGPLNSPEILVFFGDEHIKNSG